MYRMDGLSDTHWLSKPNRDEALHSTKWIVMLQIRPGGLAEHMAPGQHNACIRTISEGANHPSTLGWGTGGGRLES